MNRKIAYILLFAFFAFPMAAQELLTVEDAVKIALENNYDIRIASNDLRIDKENVSLGNAGFLPTVDATITDNNSIQNSSQTRSDGTTTSLDNARNSNLGYGVNLGWTVFDGFRMFARYDQLKELQKLGETQLRLKVLDRVREVMSTYYQLVQQQQQLSAIDSAMVISQQRVTTAQNRFSIGKAAKLEVLNSQVDLNTDQTNLLRQQELYKNTKTQLNELLARKIDIDFRVSDSVVVDNNLQLADLMSLAEKQNPQLQAQIINRRVAELQLKQVRAGRFPTVSLNTGYNFSDSNSSLGFTSQSSAHGLNYGFSASMNIFDGFNQRRNEKVASISIENSKIAIEQQTQALQSQMTTAFQTYQTNLNLIGLEEKNRAIAKQNLDITLEKYRIGTITTLELRTAQLNYINAVVRYSEALSQVKLSEIALRELAGNLVL